MRPPRSFCRIPKPPDCNRGAFLAGKNFLKDEPVWLAAMQIAEGERPYLFVGSGDVCYPVAAHMPACAPFSYDP